MRVLHYTLGLPPIRTGGLTRYAMDLMEEQSKHHEVFHLYPGKVDILNKKSRISLNEVDKRNITHYELINSLPLPLFRGIKNPDDFIVSTSKDIYMSLLIDIKPDIIHIHTLMGIHKEFFDSAQELKIKLVFTTHDYFGICPTINLYKDHENTNCMDYEDGKGCVECCFNAMGTKSLRLAQTPIYPALKKLKKLKPTNKVIVNQQEVITQNRSIDSRKADKYVELREFYLSMLRMIDFFHFNSTIAKQVYMEYLPNIEGEVVEITHSGIKQTEVNKVESTKIRIGYLGPMKQYKGFFILLDAFKKLSNQDYYELHLYGDDSTVEDVNNVYTHGKYSMKDLETIFSNIDVLIVPSIWRETFGFVTLEGLSAGTPVIVSENVGSKDIVKENYGWRVDVSSADKLVELLRSLNRETLSKKRLSILKEYRSLTIKEHSSTIIKKVYNHRKFL